MVDFLEYWQTVWKTIKKRQTYEAAMFVSADVVDSDDDFIIHGDSILNMSMTTEFETTLRQVPDDWWKRTYWPNVFEFTVYTENIQPCNKFRIVLDAIINEDITKFQKYTSLNLNGGFLTLCRAAILLDILSIYAEYGGTIKDNPRLYSAIKSMSPSLLMSITLFEREPKWLKLILHLYRDDIHSILPLLEKLIGLCPEMNAYILEATHGINSNEMILL